MVEVSTSSLIGVAIACGGNVLISLALTVQKLAHRRQNEELVAAHSASASEASSPGASSPRMETPTGDSTAVATPTQNTAIPVLVQLDTEDSTDGHDGALDNSTGEATDSGGKLGQRPTRGNTDKKGSGVQTISLTNAGPSEVFLSSPTGTRQRSDDKKSSHDEGTGTGRDGGAGGHGKPEVEEGQYLKSKLWWLGLSLIAIGEGGNFLSYGFAPASVVAPLGTVALIANCIFAPVILKERFHAKELFGMGLAILGAVVVVWSSKASNPRLDPHGLQKAIIQIPFIVYTAINLVFIIILLLLSRSPRFGPKYIGIDVGVCALFGGYTVLSTKALSSLLSTIFLNALEYWITWLLIAVLVVTSVLQVKYLNRALMRFQSKEVIPTQFVFFSLAAIIGSAVLYQEFRDVSISQFVNFAFGIATTFFGVHLLTSFSSSEEEEDDEEGSTPNSRPDGPQRVLSSASLNLLLPSTSRMSYTERSPLLISATSDPGVAYRPAVAVLGRSPIGSVPMTASTTGSAGGGQVVKARLIKRSSTSDFSPLGLGSQAGFLLLASTPPTSAGGVGSGSMRRDRSASRSQVGPHGQVQGQVGAIPEVRDEERQAGGGV